MRTDVLVVLVLVAVFTLFYYGIRGILRCYPPRPLRTQDIVQAFSFQKGGIYLLLYDDSQISMSMSERIGYVLHSLGCECLMVGLDDIHALRVASLDPAMIEELKRLLMERRS